MHTEEVCICYTCSYKGTTNKIMRLSRDKDIYIYMGRPLERSGLLNQQPLIVYTCKYMRNINKVGVITHEDLRLIYESGCFI